MFPVVVVIVAAVVGYNAGGGPGLLVFLAGMALWAVVSVVGSFLRERPFVRAERRARGLIASEVDKHIDTLARKRIQLWRIDDYGAVDDKGWRKEIERFLRSTVIPQLTPEELQLLQDILPGLAFDLVEAQARDRSAALQNDLVYDEAMSPSMFEHYCAAVLRENGWKCEITQASGDQGVDVIATKNGKKIAVQCKKHAHPVGNKAVQEIVAARTHVGATISVVVSTAGYTKSAKELAASNRTLLLHHLELANIDHILDN